MKLSQYDLVSEFTAFEIACLMANLDPIDVDTDASLLKKIDIFLRRMEKDFVYSLKYLKNGVSILPEEGYPSELLISVNLDNAYRKSFFNEPKKEITKNNPFAKLIRDQIADNGENNLNSQQDSDFISEYDSWFSLEGFDRSAFNRTVFTRWRVSAWIDHIKWNEGYSFNKIGDDNVEYLRNNFLEKQDEKFKRYEPPIFLKREGLAVNKYENELQCNANRNSRSFLTTRDIATAFEDICDRSSERWIKHLSATKYTWVARISLGEQGGAPATWDPLLLAILDLDRTKGKEEQVRLGNVFLNRFNTRPKLAQWKDEFAEYHATFVFD